MFSYHCGCNKHNQSRVEVSCAESWKIGCWYRAIITLGVALKNLKCPCKVDINPKYMIGRRLHDATARYRHFLRGEKSPLKLYVCKSLNLSRFPEISARFSLSHALPKPRNDILAKVFFHNLEKVLDNQGPIEGLWFLLGTGWLSYSGIYMQVYAEAGHFCCNSFQEASH